ncbi:MAG: hypothetical protein PHS62_00505 [Patescibacteria group bacterium]|nr:hypothetical protein [Patescibacteria group bacterium]
MTLSPEQFNKLVTKDEFNELKTEIKEMGANVKRILTGVDGIAKKHQTFEVELTANQAAHDRFEERIKVLEEK